MPDKSLLIPPSLPRKITITDHMDKPPVSGGYIFKLIKLAYRNLFRNRRRSLFGVIIAAAGFAALSMTVGYYRYTMYGLEELTIRNGFGGGGGVGHVQIKNKLGDAREEQHAYEFGLNNVAALTKVIQDDPDVADVFPRIAVSGLISNGDKSVAFKGYGIAPESEAKLRNGLSEIDPTFSAGDQMLPLAGSKNGVLLGTKLASILHAKVGDMLMIYGTTVDGAINGMDVMVSGIMSTGVNQVDEYYLLSSIQTAQQLINTDKVSYLAVMFKNREQPDQQRQRLAAILQKKFPAIPLGLYGWEQGAEFYSSVKALYNFIFLFMGTIVLLIVALSCWNIMHMATMERVREIGTLRAIGLSIGNICMIFFFEAMFIGVISVVSGAILHSIISTTINSSVIMMPAIPGMNRGYPLRIFGLSIYQVPVAAGIIAAISFSWLSSFFTIRKMSVIDSLEHN